MSTVAVIRKYAAGQAPYLGVPVFSLREGRYVTALFRREHLASAAASPHLQKVTYDEREQVLVFDGGKRSQWRLRNLNSVVGRSGWREEIAQWSRARRAELNRKTADPKDRRSQKLEGIIAKLEREQKKISLLVPLHPMLSAGREERNYQRGQEIEWRQEKAQRREIGWLAHRPRKTWKQFYANVETVLGRSISLANRHERVCRRRGGPDVIDYLKHLPKYLGMAEQPWRPPGLSPDCFENHRLAQLSYLRGKRQHEALQSWIDAHRQEIRELKGGDAMPQG